MNKAEQIFLNGVSQGSRIGEIIGIPFLLNIFYRKKVRILMFHGVTKKHDSVANFDYKHVEVEKLEKFIIHLKKSYTIISLDNFIAYKNKKIRNIPNNAIILTFDDGYKNCYTQLFPLLKKYNVPATIFLPTAYIDKKEIAWYDTVTYCIAETKEKEIIVEEKKYSLDSNEKKVAALVELKRKVRDSSVKREQLLKEIEQKTKIKRNSCNSGNNEDFQFMTWEQCREMQKAGISFGSHSVTHQIMIALSESEGKDELLLSKQTVEEKLNKECIAFAYPFGYSNTIMQKMLHGVGYHIGLSTTYGANSRATNAANLKRIALNNWYDVPTLMLTLFINFPSFHHWLRKGYSRWIKLYITIFIN